MTDAVLACSHCAQRYRTNDVTKALRERQCICGGAIYLNREATAASSQEGPTNTRRK